MKWFAGGLVVGLVKLTLQVLGSKFCWAETDPAQMGLAQLDPVLDGWESMMRRVDTTMYRAKAQGRNRAVEDLNCIALDIAHSHRVSEPASSSGRNLEHASSIAKELKEMGCKLSLDDFGQGYFSLLHLQALPFDELKVDRSFVTSMTERRESRRIVAGVVGLVHSLGLRTVAEGIQTREQAETMRWLGCELGQGWYFGRPLPAEDIASVVAKNWPKSATSDSSPWKEISSANLDGSLSQQVANLQAVYYGAPVGLCFVDKNLRHVNINQRLADLNGHSVHDHLGHTIADLVSPIVYSSIEPYLLRALKGEMVTDVEVKKPSPHPGEGTLIYNAFYQPALDESGEVIDISIAVVDVTESKRAEAALRHSEERYRNAMQLSPHIPWILDSNGMNVEVGPMWEYLTGQTPQQTLNLGYQTVVHPEDLPATISTVQNSLISGEPMDVEYRICTRDGAWLWLRSRASASRGADGQITEWYGTSEDISELKQLRQALQFSIVPQSATVRASSPIVWEFR